MHSDTTPHSATSTTSLAAIVLCAGQGTRMRSSLPKVIHPLLGQPMGSYPLKRALEVGAQKVVAVTGFGADRVEEVLKYALSESSNQIHFALQEKQLGTAHAVLSAKSALDGFHGDIFILYGDVPLVSTQTLQALVQAKAEAKNSVALVTTTVADPTGYGRIVRDASNCVRSIVEHKDADEHQRQIKEINAGLYLVDSDFLWESLSKLKNDNAQHELYLTDLIALAFESGRPAATVLADFEEVGGVNDRAELSRATSSLQKRINLGHMKNGVAMELSDSILIDETVVIEADVTIEQGVRLKGKTIVREGSTIGQGSIIRDSEVKSGAEILPYSILDEAIVGEGAKVGPFARLRPGTVLEESVHVGNFVETKKATLMKGAKANHLTYLGDCDIGEATNIGAGTITCNYDGQHKHRTVIGKRVFVGSDSQFVAPVTIGDNVLIGAGSTITKDVPSDSMAIARGKQKTFEGYMKDRRPGDKKGE